MTDEQCKRMLVEMARNIDLTVEQRFALGFAMGRMGHAATAPQPSRFASADEFDKWAAASEEQRSISAATLDDERAACDTAYKKQVGNRRTDENDFGAGWESAIEWIQDRTSDAAQADTAVPDDVRAAVERMCNPLDKSLLSGATADADAHCMALIRAYVLGDEPAAKQ
ncbi:hypothetical protein [Paraburkholderia saeva]|uniref:hypothetical protein n=1 Tax=Paraburkholderia saeva TaxID=2777537 RepID=UPI001DBAF647|nr:hypothetical protein [Paraburkholderia saeva]CAG4887734.1 hypothetical protein R52603_00501 [Paraburkholderia saeva]